MKGQLLETLIALAWMIGVAMGAEYGGAYRLTGGLDGEQNEIAIPADYGDFLLQVEPAQDMHHYQIGIKIGNSLGAGLTLTGPVGDGTRRESIQVGFVRSTRMLPPPPLAALERQITKMLPTMKTIELDRGVLQLRGDDGDLKFTSTLDATN